MSTVLKGAPVASALSEDLAVRTRKLTDDGITPCMAIVRVGERADDLAYEQAARKRCEKIGISVRQFVLPADVTQAELLDTIALINTDKAIHACLLFRPLPKSLDEEAACAALSPWKDVDGITPYSMAKVFAGRGIGFAPCTAQSCMALLEYYGIEVSGRRIAVVGRSLVIGRPISLLFTAADGTVTLCHTRTLGISAITREADLVVLAAGKAEAFGPEYFRPGQVVLDVGINWSERKQRLVGDVDYDRVEPIVSAITPVPAGVGAVTTAVLCGHVIEAAERASLAL